MYPPAFLRGKHCGEFVAVKLGNEDRLPLAGLGSGLPAGFPECGRIGTKSYIHVM